MIRQEVTEELFPGKNERLRGGPLDGQPINRGAAVRVGHPRLGGTYIARKFSPDRWNYDYEWVPFE